MSDKPLPHKFWRQAQGDVSRYMEPLVEHKRVIPREREPGPSDSERLMAVTRRERAECSEGF